MAVIPNLTGGSYVPTGRGASQGYTGNPYITPTTPWFNQSPPQYAGGNPWFNEQIGRNVPSPYENNPQAYWNTRNQITGLGMGGYNPNGMGNWNPWANYGSSAMGGFQGGLGRPGLGYGTNPNQPSPDKWLPGMNPYASATTPSTWQGMPNTAFDNRRAMDHIGGFSGTNPWAGQTTNYIRRPSGGRVPR